MVSSLCNSILRHLPILLPMVRLLHVAILVAKLLLKLGDVSSEGKGALPLFYFSVVCRVARIVQCACKAKVTGIFVNVVHVNLNDLLKGHICLIGN